MRALRALLGLAWLSAPGPLAAGVAGPVEVEGCPRIVVRVDDPAEVALGQRVAELLCQAREGLPPRLRQGAVRARITRDLAAYRARTGRAWYIAAALVGDEIVTQPARSLARLEDLPAVLAHELAHLALRRLAGPGLPRWLDEGLAQRLAGTRAPGEAPPGDERALEALEGRLAAADGPDEGARRARERDYRAALALVERLCAHPGLEALLEALPRLRGHGRLGQELAGRKLRDWLFDPR